MKMVQSLENQIIALIEPIVEEEGCRLITVEITSEMGQRVLRVSIDKENGVTLDDCSRISASIEDIIEVEEIISGRYNLEVSSPGLDRPLRKGDHFQEAIGQTVKITTFEKINGRANYKGILKNIKGDIVSLLVDNEMFELPLGQIKKANLANETK